MRFRGSEEATKAYGRPGPGMIKRARNSSRVDLLYPQT